MGQGGSEPVLFNFCYKCGKVSVFHREEIEKEEAEQK
jgi:hypothetical protein